MLEKPDIPDQLILSHVGAAYEVAAAHLTFLPLGADINTAVYRLVTQDQTACFLKLRKKDFDPVTVDVPHFLKAQGVPAVIAPLTTVQGQSWARMDGYHLILYPYVQGENGYEAGLTHQQWVEFGSSMRKIHTVRLPAGLRKRIKQEDFTPRWREMVEGFQAQIEHSHLDDPIAEDLAVFMRLKRDAIAHMVLRAGQLGRLLQTRVLELALCHSDIHPGNLLICSSPAPSKPASSENSFYIVDWDNPILAPKERDLMFIGSGMARSWNEAGNQDLFFQGYGPVEIDLSILAYYRYERIIQDIAEFCQQIFSRTGSEEDRAQAYRYFTGQFLPDNEVDIAFETDRTIHRGAI